MSQIYADLEHQSSLVSKNITVLGRRTSVRLEPEMWRELKNISARERCTIHDLCSLISLRKNTRTSLTAAIRVFLMLYFRAAATEEGHTKVGHGDFENMKRRAGMVANWSALAHKREQDEEQENIDKRVALQQIPFSEDGDTKTQSIKG
jgi:predicted DNA-binding ribbon-helix-helix protein